MGAIVKACKIGNSLKNSGKECDIAMGATAMIIALPPGTVITAADLADPMPWIMELIHEDRELRAYPFFGVNAPINVITNNAEGDTTVTLDDGLQILVRRGVYNRTFETVAGGLCYADALFGLTGSGYTILEIDQTGRGLLHKNPKTGAGVETYGGLITSFMAGLAPTLATLKDVYRNRFSYSFTPEELVNNGVIFDGFGPFLQLMGLKNVELLPGVTPNTTTKIYIKVQTECAEANLLKTLVDDEGDNPLEAPSNYIVTDEADDTVKAISAAAIVGGEMELTGVFISGHTYKVVGTSPSQWFDNEISGYDAEDASTLVTIP